MRCWMYVCILILNCLVGITLAQVCCPEGWFGYGKKCYRQFVEKKTFRKAYLDCIEESGSLFVPEDDVEWVSIGCS
ncbi:unnamed protein product [Soboliphyme baturini]|uniref:C-type lectin domain-containing protein n=1 Tax=Soboliphyme baturini TaxID=241478 RepID=A0A183JAS7_9BILA|nr:unnamed protein product [Soboliphyme baturini]